MDDETRQRDLLSGISHSINVVTNTVVHSVGITTTDPDISSPATKAYSIAHQSTYQSEPPQLQPQHSPAQLQNHQENPLCNGCGRGRNKGGGGINHNVNYVAKLGIWFITAITASTLILLV